MGADFDASWALIVGGMASALSSAQLTIAEESYKYIPEVLEDTGMTSAIDTAQRFSPSPFVGVTGTGISVDQAMFTAVITAKIGMRGGATIPQALKLGEARLMQTAQLALADAGRQAERVAMAPRGIGWYSRVLTSPSCARCVVLAGKRYRSEQAFQRHPNCFPSGVAVSGPALEAATRRWYEGELVLLTTASGEELPVTGNHPILTSRGWIPANLLQEGDQVVRGTRANGASALVVPDHDQVPSRIEDVWGALAVSGFNSVPSAPEDFHGDGQHGEVHIVGANGPLDLRGDPSLLEHGFEGHFPLAACPSGFLYGEGATELLDFWQPSHSGGLVGGLDLLSLLSVGQSGIADFPGCTHSSDLHALAGKARGDGAARNSVLLGQGVEAGPGFVLGDKLFDGNVGSGLPRWDAPGAKYSVDTRVGYAERGADLLNRLSGQVELDDLVLVRRREFSGHVYSLTSSEGWHSANSLIVSNCDCVHQPVAPDSDQIVTPSEYFDSISPEEQDRFFTKAGAEAIRNGADINQVVNARRGMYTAADGRKYTREGVTRRGYYGVTTRAGRNKAARYMPEELQAMSKNKSEYLSLLKSFGYFV